MISILIKIIVIIILAIIVQPYPTPNLTLPCVVEAMLLILHALKLNLTSSYYPPKSIEREQYVIYIYIYII